MEINKSYNMLYAYQKTNEYSNTNSTTVSKAATGATEISQGVIYERKSASTVEYATYSSTGTINATYSNVTLSSNYLIQNALNNLGFYNGPTDGYLSSDLSKKAIKNFQTTYGLTVTGEMDTTTKSVLEEASNLKSNVHLSDGMASLAASLSLDATQTRNLSRIWAFLRVGMGLTAAQASGVLGNIYEESLFSETNAQDKCGYEGKYNTEYQYSTTDKVGYGLLQWTFSSRKQGLLDQAEEMDLSYTDINAQLAYFRSEMCGEFATVWNQIKNTATAAEVSDIFLREIENPEVKNYDERQDTSNTIYAQLKEV